MNQILFENRCKCNEEISVITKNGNRLVEVKENHFNILNQTEIKCKTFQIKYDGKIVVNS
jgi:hypothetical protein